MEWRFRAGNSGGTLPGPNSVSTTFCCVTLSKLLKFPAPVPVGSTGAAEFIRTRCRSMATLHVTNVSYHFSYLNVPGTA